MTIETAIAQLTEAVKENTATLREILSVGATTATDTLVPAPRKRAAKAAPLTVVEPEPEPEPVTKETPEPECPTPTEEPAAEEPAEPEAPAAEEPTPEAPAAEEPEIEEVPDLPVPELRAKLKQLIQGKLLEDTEGRIKPIFADLRAKYGIGLIKELSDDQVAPFYKEVLHW